MAAYLLGGGIICGAALSWQLGPEQAPPFLARWLPRLALAVFALFALGVFPASQAVTAAAVQGLCAAVGFLAGGLTQTAAMAFARGGFSGFGTANSRRVVVLVLCVWATLLGAAGLLLGG